MTMRYDEHATEYLFDSVSGFGNDRCAFIAYRREAEGILDPRRMESWIVQPSELRAGDAQRRIRVDLGLIGYLTSVWFSPSGAVYATSFGGTLYMQPSGSNEESAHGWKRVDFGTDVELHGVWGLDDRDIYVWGRDAWRPLLWHIGPGGAKAMPAPPGRVTLIRGLGPELLYAAGDGGLLAKWNGSVWSRIRLGTLRNCTGFFVSDPDDLWLTTDNGKLFEGTSHGWAERLQFDAPLYDVVRWRGDVWVAAGSRGLHRVVDRRDRLEPAALEIAAVSLDARGDLLALAGDFLAATPDGSDFHISCRDLLALEMYEEEPEWRRHVPGRQ